MTNAQTSSTKRRTRPAAVRQEKAQRAAHAEDSRAPWLVAFGAVLAAALLSTALRQHFRAELVFGALLPPAFALCHVRRWRKDPCLALLSGWLFSLAAPDLNFTPLAFVAATPLLVALRNMPGVAAGAALGALTGACFTLSVFSWGAHAMSLYAGFSPYVALLLYLPFAATLALRFPLWCALLQINRKSWRVWPLLFVPLAYAACEMTHLETLPWYLGNTLAGSDRLIQAADLGGSPGLSWLIVLVNCLLLRALWSAHKRCWRPAALWCAAAVGVVAAAALYGEIRLRQLASAEANAEQLRVALVQPATPIIRNREWIPGICDALTSLAREAASASPDLIVFSETAAPGMAYQTRGEPLFCDAFRRIAAETSVPLLLDNNRIEYTAQGKQMWRSAMLLTPSGEIAGEYLKRRLAPIGEYVPLEKQLPFLGKLFRYTARYSAGKETPVLEVKGVRIAPQICFEITDPRLVRTYVARDVRLICDLANDSWFGARKEAEQHLTLARFRSVENRVAMVRATNTGISGYIDAAGRVRGELSPLHRPWVDCRTVPLPQMGSLYRRFGDLFGWSCVAFVTAVALWFFPLRFKRRCA